MRFRAQDIDNEVYYQLPKSLFSYKLYEGLDIKAKVLYAVLKDRMNLSRKNGWVEANGDIFLMFSYGDLALLLGMSKTAVCRAFKKLGEYGLIETVTISKNGAQKIYINRIEAPDSMADVHDYEDRLGRAEVESVEDEAKNMVADAYTAGVSMTLAEAREKAVSRIKETRSTSGTACSVLETPCSANGTPRSADETACSVYGTAPVPPAELNKTNLYNKTNLERLKRENNTTTTTKAASADETDDKLLQQLILAYKDNISPKIGPFVQKGLRHLCKTYGIKKVEKAITEAALSAKDGVSFKYIQSILERWYKDSTSKVVPIKADVSIPAKQSRKPEKKLDPEVDLAPDGNPLPEILPGETTEEFLARLGLIKGGRTMEALEPVGNIDFVKKLSQMSGRSELAKQNMARGEKALCLVHTLKQDYDLSQEQLARYSGELAEIEAANEQCMDCNGKDCAHKPEWRQLMVQADCTGGQYSMRVCPCRIQRDKLRQQRLEKLMVTAHVPVNYRQDTWKDFTLQPGNKRGLMLATMAAKENISLYLHGDCGTGKTKLASILANERIKSGFAVLFVSLTELFRTLQDSFDMPSKEQKDKIMPLIKSARCLILDDLGTTQRTEWKVAILQEIIDYRYANVLQTIVTSNYSLSELKEHLVIRDKSGRIKDDKQASRITSRLEEMCQVAKLDTPSFRHKQEDLLL